MSTRATYELPAGLHAGIDSVTYYVHHDGYPEGAAWKLYGMYSQLKQRKDNPYGADRMAPNAGFAEAFILANRDAEFTKHHSCHGDTEWKYLLSRNGTLEVFERHAFDCDEWDLSYSGPWEQFVISWLPSDVIREPIEPEGLLRSF